MIAEAMVCVITQQELAVAHTPTVELIAQLFSRRVLETVQPPMALVIPLQEIVGVLRDSGEKIVLILSVLLTTILLSAIMGYATEKLESAYVTMVIWNPSV